MLSISASVASSSGASAAASVTASQAASYPASVVQNGLQAVWDLAATAGIRSPTTKRLGTDTLPAGASYSGTWLFITASCTLSNWDLTTVGNNVDIGGAGIIATFNDCVFAPKSTTPNNQFYGVEVYNGATANFNYCTFNGGKYNSATGVSSGWSGSAIYVHAAAVCNADHCRFSGISYDVVKETNASYTQTNCHIQAYGWNWNNADADGVQMISGTIDIEGNLYDISDGAGQFPPSLPINSALFCTIDVPSTGDGHVTVKNNIFYGWGKYHQPGIPFNVVSVADNHTSTGSGFHIRGGTWQNNVIQKASNGYWTEGGTETAATSIASWTTNIDFDSGATIPPPVF